MSTGTLERDVAVDPRIQARRDEVERDRQRRQRRRLLAVAAVVAVAGLAYALVRSPLLDVDRVQVDATGHVSTDDVLAVAGVSPGQALVDVDPGAVRARVLALPWVDGARVRVDWSGRVRISITERVPVAAVADATGGWVLLDGSGRAVATAPAGSDPGLVVLTGVAAVPPGDDFGPAVEAPLQLVGALTPGLRSRIAGVTVGDDGSLALTVRPEGVVFLCQPDRLPDKLRRLTTLFAQVDDASIATINVCVPDSPTVTRRPR